jgi:hypothetical protein
VVAAIVYSIIRIPDVTITPPQAERALPSEQVERTFN